MENDDGLSASKRVSGGGRGERSSSSTQGFFSAKVGHERDRAALKCHCGVYAVLYLSKIANNPNRLFFGCPFFKVRLNHCKFFLWLDTHIAKFGRVSIDDGVKEEEDAIDEQFARISIEKRISDLEEKLASMEKKGRMNWMTISV